MSNTDSFIDEVSEEVRRDKLFKLMKKYGWIGIVLVLMLVGGASYIEWNKARNRTNAEALGDQILAAFQDVDPGVHATMLAAIDATGEKAALTSMLGAAEALKADDTSAALDSLRAVVNNQTLPTIYRHLAELKLLLIEGDDIPADERLARLDSLAVAGAPFRLLAEEQIAMTKVATGDIDDALLRLKNILADGEVTAALRRRVTQLIVALGGELDAA